MEAISVYFIWLRFLRNRSSDLVGAVSGFQGIGGHGDRIRDIAGGPVGQGGIAVPVGAAQFGIDPGEDAAAAFTAASPRFAAVVTASKRRLTITTTLL